MPYSSDQPTFWQRSLDKIGIGGTAFAALCCLGFPALLAILSAIGLGFLVNDSFLMPLLVVSLLITLWGLYIGIRHHHRWSAICNRRRRRDFDDPVHVVRQRTLCGCRKRR